MDRITYLAITGHLPGNVRESWSSSSGPNPSPSISSFPHPIGIARVTKMEVSGGHNPACD